jgi:3D (Asp-Asp-Asp) domain-containing protein
VASLKTAVAPTAPAAAAADAPAKELSNYSAKVEPSSKVKECCGFPIGVDEGFRLSFYWLAYEEPHKLDPPDTDIYTRDGLYIGTYPMSFLDELTMEGSGILMDGRIINYDGHCKWGVGTCFDTLDPERYPMGRGVQRRSLVPFKSIAVDPRYIPIGDTVYLPELDGVLLPDGTRHDGCLRADDQGGAIKHQKIDFFVVNYANFRFIADNLWWRLRVTPHLEEPKCRYLHIDPPL